MTIEEMQRRKKEFGYSNEKLAELSGVPLGTVQKVMSGSTKSPRQGTLEALARALNGQKEVPTRYPGEMIDGCIRVAGGRQGGTDRWGDLLHGDAHENSSEDRGRDVSCSCRFRPIPWGSV